MGVKEQIFKLYGFFFTFGAKVGIKENRVALISMHNANFTDSLFEVERKLLDKEILKISRTALSKPLTAIKFCTVDAFKTGRSRFIFLNDNFLALAYTKPNRKTEIVQLWHGQGAFKKFGFDIPQPEEIRTRERALSKRISYVVCSSDGVKDIYANAFGVPIEKVITSGTPNEDYYFRITSEDKNEIRNSFNFLYPNCKGKKLVLYAPTFREGERENADILRDVDFCRLKKAASSYFGEEAEILVRLHPQVHEKIKGNKNFINVTDYPNVNELAVISDVLITDYSSICMDFSLQGKPMVFYAYDLQSYKGARDFYFDYESYVPGAIATNNAELIEVFESGNFKTERNEVFRHKNFGIPNGKATDDLLATLHIN
ncbi:MAG: CDP-glycerol glycerophosphotransferase family protein [Oscillospiraceae bacterium]|nr:CDP-glycerol glycerophosphotransferase family protein [Oscillospiraceae bacterium]